MSTSQRLLRGAAWSYGAQLTTVTIQIVYAAITSRAVGAAGFGAYGVALSAAGIFSLVASAGLSQTVGRLRDGDETELPAICSYALFMGIIFAVLTFVLAAPVAEIWGVAEAAPALRSLAIVAFLSPLFGVSAGLMRREGSFRQLAIATLLCNIAGMAIGAVAVLRYRDAQSLVVSAVTAQVLLTTVTVWYARARIRLGRVRRGTDAIGFSGKVIGSSVLQYVIGNAARFTSANVLGPQPLGQWNRAEVLSSMPFQQMQTALVPVVYPEFRHDRENEDRPFLVWADMLSLLAWVTVPLGIVGAAVLPAVVPMLFGDQWKAAGLYAAPLALAGGMQPVVVLLAAAIESLGDFKIIWITNGALLIVQISLAAAVLLTRSIWPAIFGLLISHLVSHTIYAYWAYKRRLLDLHLLLRNYLQILTVSLIFGACAGLVSYGLANAHLSLAFAGAIVATPLVTWALLNRRTLPPVLIMMRRRIIE